jgi:TRAP-type transport system periplasmic protein
VRDKNGWVKRRRAADENTKYHKKEGVMRRSMWALLILVLVAVFCCPALHAAGPVELKAVSYQGKDNRQNLLAHEWVKRVNEGLKGQVQVKYLGGPEVVPSREQFEATKNNVVQIGFIPIALYRAFLEEANAYALSQYNPMEMRKSGFYDFLVQSHEKVGLRYLGPFHYGKFYLWTNKPVTKLDDFKGMKLRSNVTYDRFMKYLGSSPVTVQPGEVFTALERGVVDGYGFPLIGARDNGWTQITKNVIDHPFYLVDLAILVNLNTWNKLPKQVRDKIEEITVKYEPDMVAACDKLHQEEWVQLANQGVKKITFTPDEAKKYTGMAYQARWEELGEKVPADVVQKLKKMTGN